MKAFRRYALWLAATLALGAAVRVTDPVGGARLRSDFADPPPHGEGAGRETLPVVDFEGRFEAARLRILAKGQIADALVAGRLTLPEAAARLRDVDARSLDFRPAVFERAYPGNSDDERYCRAAIGWAASRLHGRPDEAPEVVVRLERELDAYLRRGTLRLPAPADPPAPPR